jgi:hypothetical protein
MPPKPSAAAVAHAAASAAAGNAPISTCGTTADAPEVRIKDGKIQTYTVGHLVKTAQNAVIKKSVGSTIFDEAAETRLPKFDGSGT